MKELHTCEDCLWNCNCGGENCSEICPVCDEKFESEILPRLIAENEVSREMWMEEDEDDLSEAYYYSTAINDSLKEIRKYETAFLYNLREVKDILRFEPDINIIYSDGIYYAKR